MLTARNNRSQRRKRFSKQLVESNLEKRFFKTGQQLAVLEQLRSLQKSNPTKNIASIIKQGEEKLITKLSIFQSEFGVDIVDELARNEAKIQKAAVLKATEELDKAEEKDHGQVLVNDLFAEGQRLKEIEFEGLDDEERLKILSDKTGGNIFTLTKQQLADSTQKLNTAELRALLDLLRSRKLGDIEKQLFGQPAPVAAAQVQQSLTINNVQNFQDRFNKLLEEEKDDDQRFIKLQQIRQDFELFSQSASDEVVNTRAQSLKDKIQDAVDEIQDVKFEEMVGQLPEGEQLSGEQLAILKQLKQMSGETKTTITPFLRDPESQGLVEEFISLDQQFRTVSEKHNAVVNTKSKGEIKAIFQTEPQSVDQALAKLLIFATARQKSSDQRIVHSKLDQQLSEILSQGDPEEQVQKADIVRKILVQQKLLGPTTVEGQSGQANTKHPSLPSGTPNPLARTRNKLNEILVQAVRRQE